MTTTPHRRSAIGALYAGLGLTAVALAAADHGTTDVLAEHIDAAGRWARVAAMLGRRQ